MSIAMPQGPEIYDLFVDDEENIGDIVVNVIAEQGLQEDFEDVEEVYEAFASHYGFDSFESMENFMLGQGQWDDRQAWTKDEDAMTRQQIEFEQMGTQCHRCLEDIQEYLAEGAMRGEIDKDPYIENLVWDDEADSYKVGEEGTTEYHLAGSCDEHDDVWFHYIEKEN